MESIQTDVNTHLTLTAILSSTTFPRIPGHASAAGPRALLFIEYSNVSIESGLLSALTAATKLYSEVVGRGLVVNNVSSLVEKAKR